MSAILTYLPGGPRGADMPRWKYPAVMHKVPGLGSPTGRAMRESAAGPQSWAVSAQLQRHYLA